MALTKLAGKPPSPRAAALRVLKGAWGDVIDQAMVLWFPGPHSVTGEDVAEFHVHGSPAVLEVVLSELAAIEGLALAEPGEFSRRAFENGKLDLVEVEGLADLLSATGDAQRRLAMRQFLGEASAAYEGWRSKVISALALHEAAIDFVEEDDVAARARDMAGPVIAELVLELGSALSRSAQNAAIRSGLRLVIAGPPNAGKSSLLNALAGREAAIVSPVPGTTRDVVEAQILFEGVPLILQDTAGLRAQTGDQIEAEGMARAQSAAAAADILLWVTAPDVTETVGPARIPDLVVGLKADLDSIRTRNDEVLAVSSKTGFGLSGLRLRLKKLIQHRVAGVDDAVVVRHRHVLAVQETIRLLNDCLAEDNRPHELITEDLRKATLALGSITGHVGVEDLLTKIFAEFCIGK